MEVCSIQTLLVIRHCGRFRDFSCEDLLFFFLDYGVLTDYSLQGRHEETHQLSCAAL